MWLLQPLRARSCGAHSRSCTRQSLTSGSVWNQSSFTHRCSAARASRQFALSRRQWCVPLQKPGSLSRPMLDEQFLDSHACMHASLACAICVSMHPMPLLFSQHSAGCRSAARCVAWLRMMGALAECLMSAAR